MELEHSVEKLKGGSSINKKYLARERILEKNQVGIFGRKSMNFLLVS